MILVSIHVLTHFSVARNVCILGARVLFICWRVIYFCLYSFTSVQETQDLDELQLFPSVRVLEFSRNLAWEDAKLRTHRQSSPH